MPSVSLTRQRRSNCLPISFLTGALLIPPQVWIRNFLPPLALGVPHLHSSTKLSPERKGTVTATSNSSHPASITAAAAQIKPPELCVSPTATSPGAPLPAQLPHTAGCAHTGPPPARLCSVLPSPGPGKQNAGSDQHLHQLPGELCETASFAWSHQQHYPELQEMLCNLLVRIALR